MDGAPRTAVTGVASALSADIDPIGGVGDGQRKDNRDDDVLYGHFLSSCLITSAKLRINSEIRDVRHKKTQQTDDSVCCVLYLSLSLILRDERFSAPLNACCR